MPQLKSLIWMRTTAEKEGMTEEQFKDHVRVIKEQLVLWNEFKKTHQLVFKGNIGTWEPTDVVA